MPWPPSGAIGVLSHVPCSSIASASLYAVLFPKPCSLLLIVHAQERCIYRLIEINDGFRGPIATSETLFYCCDSLVLFLALAVFVPFWPGRFITSPDARLILADGTPVEDEDEGVQEKEVASGGSSPRVRPV